mgnify:CR=1 FL=1
MLRRIGIRLATTSAVVLAACGSHSTPAPVAPSPSPAPSVSDSATPTPTTVSTQPTLVLADSRYGKILADEAGRTLYLFTSDRGTDSTCSTACATTWPPLLVSTSPIVGSGLTPSLVSVSVRSDGGRQLVYNGHPLYTYIGDHAPGEIKCQAVVEFGGGWFVIDGQGNQVSTP